MSPIDFRETGQTTECMHPWEYTRSAPPRDETVHITPDAGTIVTEQDQPDNETQQAMPVQQVDTPRAGHRNVTFANIKPRRSQRETKGRPPKKLDL